MVHRHLCWPRPSQPRLQHTLPALILRSVRLAVRCGRGERSLLVRALPALLALLVGEVGGVGEGDGERGGDAPVLRLQIAPEEDRRDDEREHERRPAVLVDGQHGHDRDLSDQQAHDEPAAPRRPQLPAGVVAGVVDVDHLVAVHELEEEEGREENEVGDRVQDRVDEEHREHEHRVRVQHRVLDVARDAERVQAQEWLLPLVFRQPRADLASDPRDDRGRRPH
mmetsp:Transcript_42254/g.99185  ORF Transcript_42254/g.99185 Transcript_42254/m.99185 type:complete len:224 (-) Transcript_42254:1741-2412(-)